MMASATGHPGDFRKMFKPFACSFFCLLLLHSLAIHQVEVGASCELQSRALLDPNLSNLQPNLAVGLCLGAIHDQELVLEEKRLRNYGTGAARSEQAGQGSNEVDKKNDPDRASQNRSRTGNPEESCEK